MADWRKPNAEKISGETLAETYLISRRACWGCTIRCGRVTSVKSGPFQILASEGPEYESVWALGSSTAVKDLDAVVKANHHCVRGDTFQKRIFKV